MSYRTRVTSVYLLVFFIDLINMFIANVGYPKIGRHFDAAVSQLAWVSTGYLLGLTLVIPLSGWLARRMGLKRLFMLSLVIFIVATCGAGSALSLQQLIIWRLIQGLGGGLLIPLGQTMTYSLYQNHERAKLSAVVMIVGLLAPALSPAIGGMLVDRVSWRWVFFASLPLALLALMLAACWLNADRQTRPTERLDLSGLLAACTALTLILLGLTGLGEEHHRLYGGIMLSAGLISMVWYACRALRKEKPLLNLRLLREPLLQTSMLVYQLIPGIFTGVNLAVMLYLQDQLGLSATWVGAMMLPWALASFAAISLTGKTFNHWGPRPLLITGSLLQGAGMAFLTQVGSVDDVIIIVCAFILMGFGGSLCSSTAQSSAFIHINDAELADASALWNINRQLSFCFGVTLIGLLLNFLLSNTGWPADRIYHLCFALAACSAAIPILLSCRIDNRSVILAVNQEKS